MSKMIVLQKMGADASMGSAVGITKPKSIEVMVMRTKIQSIANDAGRRVNDAVGTVTPFFFASVSVEAVEMIILGANE